MYIKESKTFIYMYISTTYIYTYIHYYVYIIKYVNLNSYMFDIYMVKNWLYGVDMDKATSQKNIINK